MAKMDVNKRRKFEKSRQFFRKRFNFRRWMSWDHIQESSHALLGYMKSLFLIGKAENVETYVEAKRRLSLSESQLAYRRKRLALRAKFYALLGLLVLSYAYYLIVYTGAIGGGLCTMLLAGPAFALGFRASFWSYQMKRERLGCSLDDWLRDNCGIARIWFRNTRS